MQNSTQIVSVLALLFMLSACGGSSSDGVADLATDAGWHEIPLKILEVGYLAEPGMLAGFCIIGIQNPGPEELAGAIWPDSAPVFAHIGESVNRCLSGAVEELAYLPSNYKVYLDQLVRIDYNAEADDCGAQMVGGCYLEWADLAVVLPERLSDLVSKDVTYDALEAVVVGHEIWHMVAGDFHP